MTAPPPSKALLEKVSAMKPVRTRAPLRSLALVVAAFLGLGAIGFALSRLRVDFAHLPLWWRVLVGAIWAAAVLAPLWASLVPRRSQVLPDVARAGRLALAVTAVLLAVSFFFTIDAPGHSRPADPLGPTVIHCLGSVLKMWAGAFVIALIAARKLLPVGTWRAGAAIGAAGGALGGLLLHFICAYASGLHVGLAHAGGVVLCALLGASLTPLILRR